MKYKRGEIVWCPTWGTATVVVGSHAVLDDHGIEDHGMVITPDGSTRSVFVLSRRDGVQYACPRSVEGETMKCIECGSSGPSFGYRSEDEKPICYACCARLDAEAMIRDGEIYLYLVGDEVINWPGSLRFGVIERRESRHACWAHRHRMRGYVPRVDFWFVGPDRRRWHGVVRGDMDLARCKRNGG